MDINISSSPAQSPLNTLGPWDYEDSHKSRWDWERISQNQLPKTPNQLKPLETTKNFMENQKSFVDLLQKKVEKYPPNTKKNIILSRALSNDNSNNQTPGPSPQNHFLPKIEKQLFKLSKVNKNTKSLATLSDKSTSLMISVSVRQNIQNSVQPSSPQPNQQIYYPNKMKINKTVQKKQQHKFSELERVILMRRSQWYVGKQNEEYERKKVILSLIQNIQQLENRGKEVLKKYNV